MAKFDSGNVMKGISHFYYIENVEFFKGERFRSGEVHLDLITYQIFGRTLVVPAESWVIVIIAREPL